MNGAKQTFAAGSLAFRIESDTGFVRDIRFHGHEVLRGIYPAVRNSDWGTALPKVESLEVQSASNSIRLFLRAHVLASDLDVEWTAEIEASGMGRLRYGWRATAKSASKTNRTGLCVLHPAEMAGTSCIIEHTDGSREAGCFPREISPHQPFRDIRSLTYSVANLFEISIGMDGDVFEMEDQRNWTDASFKTYCRPLSLPYPYLLQSGDTVEQSVTLQIGARLTETETTPPIESKRLTSIRLPEIGFTLPGPTPPTFRNRLRALNPGHVRVETTRDTSRATLAWAVREVEFLNCALILAVRGADEHPLDVSSLPSHCTLHLFDGAGNGVSGDTLEAWHRAGHTDLATGTLHNFAELNRKRPPAVGPHRAIVFGINAQVHTSDDDSIFETLTQHGTVALTARKFGQGRQVSVAPISLGRRSDSVDSRIRKKFGAEWLLGSLKRLAQADCVERVTFFHAHGPAGFMDEHAVTPAERLFLALAGSDSIPPDFSLPA